MTTLDLKRVAYADQLATLLKELADAVTIWAHWPPGETDAELLYALADAEANTIWLLEQHHDQLLHEPMEIHDDGHAWHPGHE